ncbi:hypothetical protein [Sporisorium scitamineum]|uniref:Uncharacterized protein n=1 Tax=Sporisorium scitamineum TaxID=49012 RepID=A0A0F7RRM7_9BASI|nr:hypothetical protein [Sporisorium scitamineum]
MFQPTWSQQASAQPPLDAHAHERSSLSQDMHPPPHMHTPCTMPR